MSGKHIYQWETAKKPTCLEVWFLQHGSPDAFETVNFSGQLPLFRLNLGVNCLLQRRAMT